MGCRHPPLRCRHRKRCKLWSCRHAGFAPGTAGAVKRGLQASAPSLQAPQALQILELQACLLPTVHLQAPQTLQIVVAGMPARLGF